MRSSATTYLLILGVVLYPSSANPIFFEPFLHFFFFVSRVFRPTQRRWNYSCSLKGSQSSSPWFLGWRSWYMPFGVLCMLNLLSLGVCVHYYTNFRFSNSSQVDSCFDMKVSRTRRQILHWMREPTTFVKWLVSSVKMISLQRCCSTVDLHQRTSTQIYSKCFPPFDKSTECHDQKAGKAGGCAEYSWNCAKVS